MTQGGGERGGAMRSRGLGGAIGGQRQGKQAAEDIDDLLGGVDMGSGSGAGNAFGFGRQKQQKPKASEIADDDPLGFIKRAEEQKRMNEQLKKQQMAEENAAYKTLIQLNYNQEGYRGTRDSINTNPSTAKAMGPLRQEQIGLQDAQDLKQLLFRSDRGNFHDSWCQGFYFDQKMKYGIFQDKGGPCGILATVQAFFLK